MHTRLTPIIRGALDVSEPAFSLAAVTARATVRTRNERYRRSLSMLAAGLVVATVAAFAGGVSSPPNVVRAGLTASTPAPAPVPQIT